MTFRSRAATVIAFAAAMAYLESAVVVYLQQALGFGPENLFPLQEPEAVGDLAAIEVGREFATLVMLATVGMLAGRQPLERLAWSAVAFGVWDIFYYGWLWVFIGWPHDPGTWDVLFFIPVPWTGPVWAPITVSLALVGFGLAAGRAADRGKPLRATRAEVGLGVLGGLVVILSFTLDAPRIVSGGMPGWFAWPVFVLGMLLAAAGAVRALSPRKPGALPTGFSEADTTA